MSNENIKNFLLNRNSGYLKNYSKWLQILVLIYGFSFLREHTLRSVISIIIVVWCGVIIVRNKRFMSDTIKKNKFFGLTCCAMSIMMLYDICQIKLVNFSQKVAVLLAVDFVVQCVLVILITRKKIAQNAYEVNPSKNGYKINAFTIISVVLHLCVICLINIYYYNNYCFTEEYKGGLSILYNSLYSLYWANTYGLVFLYQNYLVKKYKIENPFGVEKNEPPTEDVPQPSDEEQQDEDDEDCSDEYWMGPIEGGDFPADDDWQEPDDGQDPTDDDGQEPPEKLE
jgi:hypothetical protein